MSSMNIAVIALLANAVSVDGTCAAVYDGKGATVNGVVLKVDANGVMTIPADWTDIPGSAFRYCKDFKVLIPAKITAIQSYAFWASLEEIKIAAGSKLVSINERAFQSSNIISIDIPSTVTYIGKEAFLGSKIVTINIPRIVAFDAETVFQDTPCPDKSVFQPGNIVVNCKIVTTSVTATSVTTTVAEGEECCYRFCQTVAVSVSLNDVCAEPIDNTNFRKMLVCQPQIAARDDEVGSNALIITDVMGIWTDARYCMMLICGDDEDEYRRKVEAKVHTIEAGTVNDKALHKLLDCRICPEDYNFAELYGMYSFASALRMLDPPTRNPHYCRGYDACYPCGTEHIDKWPGITCDNGHVVGITISGDKKYGSCCGKTLLPNKSCILKGEIPPQIHHLEHLQVLSLYKHLITGEIPETIGKLQYLHTIQLSLNKMTGPLPKELYTLEHLEILDINDNHFVGTIHHEIDNMKALELLSLYNNKFDGEIPWSSLSVLERLYYLYLDGNVFDQQSCTREICNQVYHGDLHTFTVPPTVFCECAKTV